MQSDQRPNPSSPRKTRPKPLAEDKPRQERELQRQRDAKATTWPSAANSSSSFRHERFSTHVPVRIIRPLVVL